MTTSMPNDENFHCRVCGLKLGEPPWGQDGATPLFEYCPCCGVEFGYQDASREGARKFRSKWLHDGATWSSADDRPHVWQLDDQLKRIPKAFR